MKWHSRESCPPNIPPCKECKKELPWNSCDFAHYRPEAYTSEYFGLCFTCAFWLELIAHREGDLGNVIVDHGPWSPFVWSGIHCYYFDVTKPLLTEYEKLRPFVGFGGRLWEISFFDGRVVQTNNLWHSDEVPKRFQNRLPVNATLVAVKRTVRVSLADIESTVRRDLS